MPGTLGSEYLQWVKEQKPARFNLAASGVLPCPLAELDARIEDLEINGPSLYGFAPLQHAISAYCRVPVECVVAASGTSMANFIAMAVLVQHGDEVLIEHPVYEPILALARYVGADIKRFPRNGRLGDFVSPRTRLIVMTNLHNPTSAYLEERQVAEVADIAAGAGAMVLMDEVYVECLYDARSSAIHHGRQFVCTSSLTKAYGLGGLRCGWILAEPDLARRMWQFKDLIDSSAPHPAELLSVHAFRKLDRLAARAKALLNTNRAILADFMNSCPQLELQLPEYGTCAFPRIKTENGDQFCEFLRSEFDTGVVPGRFFEMRDHFRLGLGGETAVLLQGLERLRKALCSDGL